MSMDPATCEQEWEQIRPLLIEDAEGEALERPFSRGDTVYVLCRKWWLRWCAYVGVDPDTVDKRLMTEKQGFLPGPIDNRALMRKDSGKDKYIKDVQHVKVAMCLADNLREAVHYKLLPVAAYLALAQRHGHVSESPLFRRQVIAEGLEKKLIVEMNPFFLQITVLSCDLACDRAAARVSPKRQEDKQQPCSERDKSAATDQNASVLADRLRSAATFLLPYSGDCTVEAILSEHYPRRKQSREPVPQAEEVVFTELVKEESKRVGEEHTSTAEQGEEKEASKEEQKVIQRAWIKLPNEVWILLSDDEIHTKLKFLEVLRRAGECDSLLLPELKQPPKLVLEYLQKGKVSVMPNPHAKDFAQFEVGDIMDACDSKGIWFRAVVRFVAEAKIQVHFLNWSAKWDEWIPRDSPRLCPQHTKTSGPTVPEGGLDTFSLARGKPSSSTALDHSASLFMGHRFRLQTLRSHPSFSCLSGANQRGVCGLQNLGNTCFMNSTLQCLFQTPGLCDFFFDQKHLAQLNRCNRLGWHGLLATLYGQLLCSFWGQSDSPLPSWLQPRALKQIIGEFQPRFSGFEQHDSSEFLSFLLDGLHEDMNRSAMNRTEMNRLEMNRSDMNCGEIRNRESLLSSPSAADTASAALTDSQASAAAWAGHLSRNCSVIVDTCQGQLKSEIVCPECERKSVAFDPFMFLSVPVPTHRLVPVSVSLASLSSPLATFSLKMAADGYVRDLKDEVAKRIDKNRAEIGRTEIGRAEIGRTETKQPNWSNVILAEVHAHQIFRLYSDDALLTTIPPDATLCLYEISPPGQDSHISQPASPDSKRPLEREKTEDNRPQNWIAIQVMHRVQRMAEEKAHPRWGWPQLLTLPERDLSEFPVARLRDLVQRVLRSFLVDSSAAAAAVSAGKSETPTSSFSWTLHVVDRQSRKHFQRVPDTGSLNLAQWPTGFALCLLWNRTRAESITVGLPKKVAAQSGSSFQMNLSDCLEAFTKEEVLQDSDSWFCPHCKKPVCARKKMDISRLPPVLIIHLKRFDWNQTFRSKITTPVDFPLSNLDLRRWHSGDEVSHVSALYDLFAVSNHYGGTGGGHYTANVKNLLDGAWYNCDDSRVTPLAPDHVVSAAAYVLFYRRKPAPTL